jgi:formate hydrogenlyase subunit 4
VTPSSTTSQGSSSETPLAGTSPAPGPPEMDRSRSVDEGQAASILGAYITNIQIMAGIASVVLASITVVLVLVLQARTGEPVREILSRGPRGDSLATHAALVVVLILLAVAFSTLACLPLLRMRIKGGSK